jgi:nucleoside-diphosphate-sugar epimerase
MLTVAILGANGFIGGRAVEMLHLGGMAAVRPVVRRVSSLARLSRFAIESRVADAFDLEALREAFAGGDVVLDVVAGDRKVILDTLEPAYQAARDAGVARFVYLSTGSVHGQDPAPGTDESSPLRNDQPVAYNNAKVEAERRLLALRARGGPEVVLLRPGIVYGPRSSWTSGFADDLLAGRAYLVGGGHGICNGIYVDNLVHGISLAMTAPGLDGEAFILGDREQVTWADLYRPIAAALGHDLSEVGQAAPAAHETVTTGARLQALRVTKPVQRALSYVPPLARRVLGAAASELMRTSPAESSSPWTFASTIQPPASHFPGGIEMESLHRCQYKLPHTKASRMLGYQPVVSFEEACRRTIGWLAFAGYPVVAPYRLPPPLDDNTAMPE